MSEDVSNDAAPEVAPEVVETPETSDVVADAPEVSEAVAANPEAAQEIAEAVESGEITEAEAVEAIRKLTLKVDGQEIEEELPFDATPEMVEYLQKKLQLAAVSNKRMQEAAELKKTQAQKDAEIEAFLGRLGNEGELDAILKHFGHDPAKYAEQVLAREVERMEMSPEQRELEELRLQVKQIKEAEEKAVEARKQAEYQARVDQFSAKFQDDLMKALDDTGLPETPSMIHNLAHMMNIATDAGYDVSFGELAQIAKEEHEVTVQKTLAGLSAEDILKYANAASINDLVLKKAPKEPKKAPPTAESIAESGAKKKEVPKSKKRTESADDFFRKMQLGF